MKTLVLFVTLIAVVLAQYNNQQYNPYTTYTTRPTYQNQPYGQVQRDQAQYGYATTNSYGTNQYGNALNNRFQDPMYPTNGAATSSVMLATALTVIAARFF